MSALDTMLRPLTAITTSATGSTVQVLHVEAVPLALLNRLLHAAQVVETDYGNAAIGPIDDEGKQGTESESLDGLAKVMAEIWKHGRAE